MHATKYALILLIICVGFAVGGVEGMAAEETLKLRFMEFDDVYDTFGQLELQSNPLAYVAKGGFSGATPTIREAVPADGRGWWLYGYTHTTTTGTPSWAIVRYFTLDGALVLGPDHLYGGRGDHWNAHTDIAWNESNGELLVLKSYLDRRDIGNALYAFRSPDGGKTWESLSDAPVFYDHDAFGLIWDSKTEQYVNYQTTYQDWSKRHADNFGSQTRRVLHIRTSPDGLTWTPDTDVAFPFNLPPAQRRLNPNRVMPEESLIVPDELDPPDMEFYRMTVFPYGDRYVAMVLNYAPSPQNVNPVEIHAGHGPYLSAEWWISDDGTEWRRPYHGQDALGDAPTGIYHAPIDAKDQHRFFISGDIYAVPMDRLAGVYAKSNAEFSTETFEMPATGLFLNVDASHDVVPRPGTIAPHRQAYVMAELHYENGQVVPGYEREKAAFVDVDTVRLPLQWNGKDGSELAGQKVRLRIFFRDATIYAVYTDDAA